LDQVVLIWSLLLIFIGFTVEIAVFVILYFFSSMIGIDFS